MLKKFKITCKDNTSEINSDILLYAISPKVSNTIKIQVLREASSPTPIDNITFTSVPYEYSNYLCTTRAGLSGSDFNELPEVESTLQDGTVVISQYVDYDSRQVYDITKGQTYHVYYNEDGSGRTWKYKGEYSVGTYKW